MKLASLVVLAATLASAASSSVHYLPAQNEEASIVNAGVLRDVELSAEQVADLYARVSGLPPLVREDALDLPARDVLAMETRVVQPVLLGVCGATEAMPEGALALVSTPGSGVASLKDVKKALRAHGIGTKMYEIESDNKVEVQKWVNSKRGDKAALVVHGCSGTSTRRRLADDDATANDDTSSSTAAGPTTVQIEEFQVSLWTTVLFVSILLAAISAMVNMDVVPDSLLFAKFQATRTSKND